MGGRGFWKHSVVMLRVIFGLCIIFVSLFSSQRANFVRFSVDYRVGSIATAMAAQEWEAIKRGLINRRASCSSACIYASRSFEYALFHLTNESTKSLLSFSSFVSLFHFSLRCWLKVEVAWRGEMSRRGLTLS